MYDDIFVRTLIMTKDKMLSEISKSQILHVDKLVSQVWSHIQLRSRSLKCHGIMYRGTFVW